MKILIAEDGLTSRRRLEVSLTKWGHEVILLTTQSEKEDIVRGLEAGAGDYITSHLIERATAADSCRLPCTSIT